MISARFLPYWIGSPPPLGGGRRPEKGTELRERDRVTLPRGNVIAVSLTSRGSVLGRPTSI